jgi:hypothetical protein
MASYTLRSYLVNLYSIRDVNRLRDLMKGSVEVSVRRAKGKEVSFVSYLYNEEADVVHLKNAPEDPNELSYLTLQELFESLEAKSSQTICVTTRNYFPVYIPWAEREVIDWPKMITDLEKAGKIEVSETKSVLAVDPRRFFFIGESEDTSIDVDFLGSSISRSESDRVVEEWEKIA